MSRSAAPDTGPCLDRRDLVAAALVGLVHGLLYLAFQQTRVYGDGGGLTTLYALGGGEQYHNVLYLPSMRLLGALVGQDDPYGVPLLLSVVSGAIGVACTFLVARAFGADRPGSAIGAALVGTAPAVLFFSTTVEVGAPHFAAVGLCACATLFAPWKRPGIALAQTALFFPLIQLTHAAGGLLGPGWVALVALARSRRAEPFSLPFLLFAVGPLLLAVLILTFATGRWLRGEAFGLSPSAELEIIEYFVGERSVLLYLWEGWLLPLSALVPLSAVALWGWRRDVLRGGSLVLFFAFSIAFFTWWRVAERGAYFLATAPFYGAAAAAAVVALRKRWPRAGTWGAAAALVVQTAIGIGGVRSYDVGFEPSERVALVRQVLGDEGALAVSHFHSPSVTIDLPGVEEIDFLSGNLEPAWKSGMPPEEFVEWVMHWLDVMVGTKRLAIDMTFYRLQGHESIDLTVPYMDALIAAIRERFETTETSNESWDLMLVEPLP